MACVVAGSAGDEIMDYYFYWCGVGVNVIAAIGFCMLIWAWFVWPFVEAASITIVFVRASSKFGVEKTLSENARQFFFWYSEFIFGRSSTRISNKLASWEGVRNWVIYSERDEKQ